MFCKYCGEQISDDSVFCSKCGKKLTESMTEKKLDPNSINPQKEEKIVIEATIKPTNNDSSETKSEGIKWISTDNLQWQRPKKARIAQICIYVLLGLLSALKKIDKRMLEFADEYKKKDTKKITKNKKKKKI